MRLWYMVGIVTLAPCPHSFGQGELKAVNVAAPTRLDWQFACAGFGPKAAALAKEYDSRKQRYVLHVPKEYHARKAWPLVLFISPGNDPAGWKGWKAVCEKNGILFCSPFAAGNSVPAGQRTRIILDALDDVRRNYRIDPDQTYISGFSGGGRMACAIGFALPEWFGGVVPVCGTNPITGPTYLRHRIEERLSVAVVTGAKDFNRKENEDYMFPWFKELNIRSKLWVAENVAHAIPSEAVFAEVYTWLTSDLKRRQADARARPDLAMAADDTPAPARQASQHVKAAETELKAPERTWRGIALLQGVTTRWPKSDAAAAARKLLKGVLENDKQLALIAEQGASDEIVSLSAQARALERFGNTAKAIEAWQLLARSHPDTPAGAKALEEIKRLKK